MKNFHLVSKNQCLQMLQTTQSGLLSSDAEKRQAENGFNEIEEKQKQSRFLKFLSQFKDIMIIILIVAAFVSILVAIIEKSQSELIDGIIILSIVLINAVLGYFQENKAENALEKIKNMTKPEAKVLRDGIVKKIPNKFLTLGDIVFLEAGDIVPADIRILESANLFCDESSLTGESVHVEKDENAKVSEKGALADRKNMLYSGNIITNGRATGVVCAIGSGTEIGKIANALLADKKELTPLQKNLKYVSKIITIVVLIVATITLITEIVLRPDEPLIEAFLIAVALAVAAIPESLPAVITIIMSFSVTMLSKEKVIVKKLQAVETLGSVNVICSDKTGTITQNMMTVTQMFYSNAVYEAAKPQTNGEFEKLLHVMTLCNDSKQNKSDFFGDSTETALVNYSFIQGISKSQLEKTHIRIDEISFSSQRKLMSTLNEHKNKNTLYTKGGIDNVLEICSKILIDGQEVEMTLKDKHNILKANEEMASNALRVLAFAYKEISSNENKEKWESNLVFVGLVGMIDPPRPEVKEAIEKCKIAGIRPVMITGDHKVTAFAIAKEVGIAARPDEVMLGVEMDKLSEEEFLKALETVNVFARVSPENKVRIVQGFKKLGKVTAMTGDGVNDAPSLKAASIGVGMGITGTDITKEVADIIITDDNFATIVVAVEEGRKIYKNIQKTIKFLFSANLSEILSIFIATLIFPQFLFLLPIQILFVNLITDSFPSIAMSFEKAERDLMKSKPRNSKHNIFSNSVGTSIVINGIIQACLVLTTFYIGHLYNNFNPALAKNASTMAFICLNLIQLFYIISIRFESSIFKNNIFKNRVQVVAFAFCTSMILLVTLTPVSSLLGFVNISAFEWLISVSAAILILPFAEIVKFVTTKKHKKELILEWFYHSFFS